MRDHIWMDTDPQPRLSMSEETRAVLIRWALPVIALFSGLILGQAMIYRHSEPFAWVLLVGVWQYRRPQFFYALVGALLGVLASTGFVSATALLVMAGFIPLPYRRQRWRWLQWPIIGIGGAVSFWISAPDGAPAALIWAGAAGLGAAVLYAGFLKELDQVERGIGDRRTSVLLVTALAAVIAGLAGVHTGVVSVSLLFGSLLVLLAGVAAGPANGALAGAMLGLTLVLRGNVGGASVGLLVAGGFFSGWMAHWHWRMAGLGLALGVIGYALLVVPFHLMETMGASVVVAALLWQGIPPGWISQLSDVVTNLMAGYDEASLPDQLERVSYVMKEMATAFHIDDLEEHPDAEISEMVVDHLCRRCSLYRTCWEDNFYRSYRGLQDLMTLADSRLVDSDDVAGDLARRCIRRDELAKETNQARAKERERAGYRQRVRESRALAEVQLDGVASIMGQMADDWRAAPFQYRPRRLSLDYHVGVAQRPKAGGAVSGDTALVRDLSRNRVLLGLSDGMGVGPRAAWESGTAMALTSRLLEAGFSPELAVHAVNTTLLLRSTEDQFATLDLLLMDREDRGAQMIKVAASPSFLRRRGQVEIIRSQALPVGIVDKIGVDPIYHTLEPDDVIVMVTDGVLDEAGAMGEQRLVDMLQRLPLTDTQWMAETLLSYMLDDARSGRDDAAVMVVKVMAHRAVREMKEAVGHMTMGEWTRVTPKKPRPQPSMSTLRAGR
jgi:stage II sporulation protein E